MSVDLPDRLGIELPVVQAALGGGLSGSALAAAVSRAGGLGTVGTTVDASVFQQEIRRTRELAGARPFAANLLFPSIRRAHVEAVLSERVPVVSLFFGFDRRLVAALHEAGAMVLHQVGTIAEAKRALADGADGLIAQGERAGGHLLAREPLERIVPRLVDLAGSRPVIAAGGIHDRATAAAARNLGASGVSAGTRFLLTDESRAHGAYKARLLEARDTVVTLLFGLGWHALHRVVPNAAVERFCSRNQLGPWWVRAANRALEPVTRLLPPSAVGALPSPSLRVPLYTPMPLLDDMDRSLIDCVPLYAGACVSEIDALRTAADVTRELATA
jgi:nitronate monooxygenase